MMNKPILISQRGMYRWCNFNCGESNVSTGFIDVPGQQTIGESLLSIDREGPFNSSTAANSKVTLPPSTAVPVR